MNLEPKILLSIGVPAKLSQNKEEIEINWEKSTQSNPEIIISRGKTSHTQRVPGQASKRLKISQYAYEYFISNEIPSAFDKRISKGRNWSDLSEHEKLSFHMAVLAEGKPHYFNILN